MEERIIKVAYGEGSIIDRVIVSFVERKNPRVEKLVRGYRATREVFQSSVEGIRCPDNLTERLVDYPRRFQREPISLLGRIRKATYTFGAVTAVFLLGVVLLNGYRTELEKREIREATLQAKATFAMISEIMGDTQALVIDDVIGEKTVRPLQESITHGHETLKRKI